MGSTEETDRKRRNHNNHSVSPPLKKQLVGPHPDDKKLDAAMLQYQNHKLAQQLDVQRAEIHALESNCNELRAKQASYDDTLLTVNSAWNLLVDDLELLAVRVNASPNGLRVLDSSASNNDRRSPSVPSEETFLHRLLDTGATESSNSVESALANRRASTVKTMQFLVQAIDLQRARNDDLSRVCCDRVSSDEAGLLLKRVYEELQSETLMLRSAMDALHLKHRDISLEIGALRDTNAKDQCTIKQLSDELEEAAAALEVSRRKLATLRSEKDLAQPLHVLPAVKIESKDATALVKVVGDVGDMDSSLEEAKGLAAQRLAELEESHQAQLNLTQRLHEMEAKLYDEQHIVSSRPYSLLSEQLQCLKGDLDRYRNLVDQLQAEREHALRREREYLLKIEAAESVRKANVVSEASVVDLEEKLQQCMADRDRLQLKLEEVAQAAGRKETVGELKVMVTTLHKEISMLQGQLKKYKAAAHDVHALRAEILSVTSSLDRKTKECQYVMDVSVEQVRQVKTLKDELRVLRQSEQEMQLILDMCERECFETRDVLELRRAEYKARAQVERLNRALDEHSLELRVKVANEAEAACQQRLAAAESENAKLRLRADASERISLELKETLQGKVEEGDAYISEIETIGQAYEEMQTQNQRLLQQITERDDYTTELVAESVKAKQLQTSLLAEKQLLASRMQHANAAGDLQKQRIQRLEEQAKTFLDQLNKGSDETRQCNSVLENSKRKTLELEKELSVVKCMLEGAQKELQEQGRRRAELELQLEKERFEKKRIQEQCDMTSTRASRASSQGEGGVVVERLQEEIKEYKAILKCSVCHDRRKEVVITKCYHLFCAQCIQRTLELRHRKCPGCGVPFGQNDVRNVYI